jgi:hypothetical protein
VVCAAVAGLLNASPASNAAAARGLIEKDADSLKVLCTKVVKISHAFLLLSGEMAGFES